MRQRHAERDRVLQRQATNPLPSIARFSLARIHLCRPIARRYRRGTGVGSPESEPTRTLTGAGRRPRPFIASDMAGRQQRRQSGPRAIDRSTPPARHRAENREPGSTGVHGDRDETRPKDGQQLGRSYRTSPGAIDHDHGKAQRTSANDAPRLRRKRQESSRRSCLWRLAVEPSLVPEPARRTVVHDHRRPACAVGQCHARSAVREREKLWPLMRSRIASLPKAEQRTRRTIPLVAIDYVD